jgi:hypothetical protein
MKKILLFGMALASLNAGAQKLNPKQGPAVAGGVKAFNLQDHKARLGGKQTRGQYKRTYNIVDAQDALIGGTIYSNFSTTVNAALIWQDSTMKALYNLGGGVLGQDGIWIKSFTQTIDPASPVFNNELAYGGELEINRGESFTIDSVYVPCIYNRAPTKPNIVDTLIVSVTGPQNLNYWRESQAAIITKYSGVDTITFSGITYDFNKLGVLGTADQVTIKYPLNAAAGNDTNASGWNYFKIPVNLTVNPRNTNTMGQGVNNIAMSVTFKSGDTWIPNVDSVGSSVTRFNNLRMVSFEEAENTFPPLPTKYEFNFSHIIPQDTNGWGDWPVPATYYNSNTFSYDMHWFDYVISCNNCGAPVGIQNVVLNNNIKLFPNPATSTLNVNFSFASAPKASSIEVVNAIGQVVYSSNITAKGADVKEVINTSNLSNGMYILKVTADGLSTNKQFSVNN